MKTSQNQTVFILGAGASYAAGVPLMRNFLEVSDELWFQKATTWASHAYSEVRKARQKLQAACAKSFIDIDNIESLFSTFEMATLIGYLDDLSNKRISLLPEKLRHVVYRTIELSLNFQLLKDSPSVASPYPYDAFVELICHMRKTTRVGPISIISFNYDLALDYALVLAGLEINYSFDPQQQGDNRMLLLKPHGSLNWTQSSSGGILSTPVKALKSEFYWRRLGVPTRERRDVHIDTMELLHSEIKWGEHLHPLPFIVPPTWYKAEYQRQLANVWKSAARVLGSATSIFVIGYSLPPSDQFFRSFFALSLSSESMIDIFTIFDPGDVSEQWQTLCGPSILGRKKFMHESLTFAGAIDHLAQRYLGKNTAAIHKILRAQGTDRR